MGKRKKKKVANHAEEGPAVPHTFVMHRGIVGKSVLSLENDLRLVMEPFTARNLKVRKNNVLKDFVHVAGPLGVTHFLILSKTEIGTYLRMARLPRGPTLTFKINEYSLAKDVISLIKRPKTVGSQFKNPPLLVLNGFNKDTLPMKLMTTMFQNLFPSINIQKVNLGDIRRCVLLNYSPETKLIEFRHYDIQVVPVGMSRGVKKLIQTKLPNMSKLDDISDFVLGGGCGYGSESEGEEATDSTITLPQSMPGRGNMKSQKSAIRLTEMGPRLVMQLIKVEDGLCGGEVLFHEFISKSEAEIRALKEKREKKRKLKEMRKNVQEANVKRKAKEKELNRERSIAGQRKKKTDEQEESIDSPASENEQAEDDAYWYRQEVGMEPDNDQILTNKSISLKPKIKRGTKRKSKDLSDHQVDKKKAKRDITKKQIKLKNEKTNSAKINRDGSIKKKIRTKTTKEKTIKKIVKKKSAGRRNFKTKL